MIVQKTTQSNIHSYDDFKGFFFSLGPHDALKHHFTSLKTHLLFLQLRVLE